MTRGVAHRTNSLRGQSYVEKGIQMAEMVKDPVCGMEIRPEDAVATGEHAGVSFYFCSKGCYNAFVKDPDRYAHPE